MAESLQVEISYRQIGKIAAPIALALFVPQLNLITNSIFLGHHSEESLAEAAITGVYYLVFAGLGFGLNNGLQTLISRRAGENRPEEIGKIFNQGVFIAFVVAAFGIITTQLLTPPILRAFLNPEQANKAIDFLRIRIWGLPFLYVYQLRNALLVGINQSRYLIIGTLAEALANIFFDYTLIFGKLGFPTMGFNGAAVASIISEFTGMIVIFWVISKKGIAQEFSLFRNFHFEKTTAGLIAKVSGPLAFQHAVSVLAWFFFYLLVARNASQTGLAISTAMRTVFGFFGTCFWSLAATTNSMVSNVIGQGRREEVIPLVWKISKLGLGLAVLVCLILNLFPGLYLSLFRPNESAFVIEGTPVLRLIGFVTLFLSIGTIWLNAVTGTGNSRVTFLVEVGAIIFYCIYVFVVLEVRHLSILWGWMSEVLYWTILFSLSYYYMMSKRWKHTVI
ncbi:MAG TPA: MATE family efflux transporter [Flavisolibacter sp.]|jgi:putative MATE family efflux protein|nr:MATE family efflux transporter [Flavisolibacter sp.]